MARILQGDLNLFRLLLAGLVLTAVAIGDARAGDRLALQDAPVVWFADDDQPVIYRVGHT